MDRRKVTATKKGIDYVTQKRIGLSLFEGLQFEWALVLFFLLSFIRRSDVIRSSFISHTHIIRRRVLIVRP